MPPVLKLEQSCRLAARGIQLLGPYGVLLKEVICLRIQILLL